MKSKRTMFSIIVMVLCLIVTAIISVGFVNNWQDKTIIDFILKTVAIPVLVCVVGLFLIGCNQYEFSVIAVYSLILGVAMSVLTNIIVVKNFTNDMLITMVENTPSNDSLVISTESSGSVGNILTSVLIFVIAGAIGGAIGKAMSSALRKMCHKGTT